MNFPFEPTSLFVKMGGQITNIERVSHTCDKPQDGRSRDYWYFVGDIKWNDSPPSLGTEIPPYVLCYEGDQGKRELDAILEALNAYLEVNGKWVRDGGKHEGWYANERPQKRRAA